MPTRRAFALHGLAGDPAAKHRGYDIVVDLRKPQPDQPLDRIGEPRPLSPPEKRLCCHRDEGTFGVSA